MSQTQDTIVAALMEQLIAEGRMAQVFTTLFNLAMRLERERFLGAGLYERNPDRRGYANGYKSKTLDTTAGTVTVDVPKAAGIDEPFYPQSLERGRRSSRAVMLAIAEMYVQGVSTRDAAKVMAEFGLKSLSSTQVSRAAALLDEELAAWRRRPLGEIHYLLLPRRLARPQRPRRPRRLHPARAALAAYAYRQPHRAGDPAGDQTPHQQGPRLPQPRCPAPPRHRPSSSKSTRTGQPRTASTSTGTPRMPDRPNPESPDFRLLIPTTSATAPYRRSRSSNRRGH